MGLFDIFRSRIKDLGDSLDEDALTAEEDTTEAKEALSKKEIIQQHSDEPETPLQSEPTEVQEEDEWEDWGDDNSKLPSLEKSLPERRIARDISESARPKGSRVDLHVLRS
ncbi:MAG: hypothetical protein CMB12_04055, partial [Euryarchaeota archaeon]|nr:hypothetical protein [Euryarchaeota archaeon]